MIMYPAICHYEDGGYWSEFPDLKGCYSQGDSEKEIVANSAESMEGYILALLEDGEPLPSASKIADIKTKGKDFATYVECDIANSGKYVRKNVTLPEWLSVKAERAGVNFSKALQESLYQKLGMTT